MPWHRSGLQPRRRKLAVSIVGVMIEWCQKDTEALKATYQELQRHSAGRKARICGTVENLTDVGEAAG